MFMWVQTCMLAHFLVGLKSMQFKQILIKKLKLDSKSAVPTCVALGFCESACTCAGSLCVLVSLIHSLFLFSTKRGLQQLSTRQLWPLTFNLFVLNRQTHSAQSVPVAPFTIKGHLCSTTDTRLCFDSFIGLYLIGVILKLRFFSVACCHKWQKGFYNTDWLYREATSKLAEQICTPERLMEADKSKSTSADENKRAHVHIQMCMQQTKQIKAAVCRTGVCKK